MDGRAVVPLRWRNKRRKIAAGRSKERIERLLEKGMVIACEGRRYNGGVTRKSKGVAVKSYS